MNSPRAELMEKVEEGFKHTQAFHACSTGDCPHGYQAECDRDFYIMGAELIIDGPLAEAENEIKRLQSLRKHTCADCGDKYTVEHNQRFHEKTCHNILSKQINEAQKNTALEEAEKKISDLEDKIYHLSRAKEESEYGLLTRIREADEVIEDLLGHVIGHAMQTYSKTAARSAYKAREYLEKYKKEKE